MNGNVLVFLFIFDYMFTDSFFSSPYFQSCNLTATTIDFYSEDDKTVYTRYGILEIFKKSGLVDEVLGILGNLTRAYIYHELNRCAEVVHPNS